MPKLAVTLWTVTPMNNGGARHTPLMQISRSQAKQIIADAEKHHYKIKAEYGFYTKRLERLTIRFRAA